MMHGAYNIKLINSIITILPVILLILLIVVVIMIVYNTDITKYIITTLRTMIQFNDSLLTCWLKRKIVIIIIII